MKKRVSRYDESCNIPDSHIVGEIGCNFASSKQSKTLIISDMKLFSIFRKNNTSSPVLETVVPPTTREVSESPAIPASDPSGKIVSITYGTGMPIDVLYAFINKDYEQEGYQDALVNTDAEYCTAKESIILNKLQQLFRRVLLRYSGEIREIEVQAANAKSLFALTSASILEARKATCEEHIAEINSMMEKVNAKDPEMMTMVESYRRGFTKGCAAQTANFLNPNRITA